MNYNSKGRGIALPVLLIMAVVFGMFFNSFLHRRDKGETGMFLLPQSGKLDVVLDMIDEDYVDTVSKSDLIEQAIPAILKDLDPHTVYIPANELQKVNDELKGNFGGIGVQFIMYQDTVAVIHVISGGPGEKAGILPGDRIVRVNDTVIAGVEMKDTEIMDRLKGLSGTPVNISIFRRGEESLIDFNIVRGQIPVASVDVAYMMDEQVGYIKVTRFAATTYYEFSQALIKLKRQGMTKLIVDLRSNQGGYLSEAINMINEFLADGKLIVYTQGKSQPKTDYMSNGNGGFQNLPITVLIDEYSASASEIFAGAIQDNDRGQIVGRRSFGKGLVQEQRMLSDGSALRLTVARYYTPTGRCIQKPYDKGKSDYYNDINKRYINGEFEQSDSIHFNDSLKYITPAGNIVYGGGGIMPDVFVPVDTSGYSQYFSQLSRKQLIYQYAFSYVDSNREEMSKLTDYRQILEYIKGKDLLDGLVSYAEKRGVKRDSKGMKISGKVIETQLNAYIARDLIDDEGYYPIIRELDNTLGKAYELIQ